MSRDVFEIWVNTGLYLVDVDWDVTEHDHTEDYQGYYEYDYNVLSVTDEDGNVLAFDDERCPVSDDDVIEAIEGRMES